MVRREFVILSGIMLIFTTSVFAQDNPCDPGETYVPSQNACYASPSYVLPTVIISAPSPLHEVKVTAHLERPGDSLSRNMDGPKFHLAAGVSHSQPRNSQLRQQFESSPQPQPQPVTQTAAQASDDGRSMCRQAQDQAYQYCESSASAIMNEGAGAAPSAAPLPQDISAMCGRAKDVSYVASAMDAYFANRCRAAVSHCEDFCSGSDAAVCNQYSGAETTLTSQALAAQFSAKLEAQCQKAVEAKQQGRVGAGATAVVQNSGVTSDLNINSQSGASTNSLTNAIAPTNAEPPQVAPMERVTPTQATLSQAPNNLRYGLGPQLPNAPANNSATQAQAQTQTPQGWNTHVMKGLAYGGGYASPPSLGGSTEPGASSNSTRVDRPLNLAAFLPHEKLEQLPRLNGFRGLASQYADINPPSRDIFQEISDRYYSVCLRHMLFNCDGLVRYSHKKGHIAAHGLAAGVGEN